MRARLLRLAVAAAMLTSGCSLLGLDDGLEQASCDSPAFCESLNTIAPTGDACLSWTCGPQSVCEILPLDEDNDGSPAPGCAPAGTDADCDDMDARRAPTLLEVCDTVDNDCDSTVDEDAGFVVAEPVTLLSVGAGVTPGQASYLERPGDAVLVSYLARGFSPVAPVQVDVLQFPNTSAGVSMVTVEPSASLPTPSASAVALSAAGSLVVGATGFAGCARVVPGELSLQSQSFGDFTVDAANCAGSPSTCLFTTGLPVPAVTAGNEVCPRTEAPAGDQTKPVGWLVAESDDSALLFGWLATAETLTESCAVPLAAEVLVSSSRVVAGSLNPATAEARILGVGTAAERPAIISLGGAGWLVAFPTASGYEIHHVEVANTLTGEVTSRAVLSRTLADVRQVSLAAGPQDGAINEFMLAYRLACGPGSEVTFARYSYDTGSGILTGGASSDETKFPASAAQESPNAVFQPAPLGYLLTWQEANKPMGARLAADGTVQAPPQRLTAGTGNVTDPFYFPLESGTGFGLVGFDPAQEALVGTELTCTGS